MTTTTSNNSNGVVARIHLSLAALLGASFGQLASLVLPRSLSELLLCFHNLMNSLGEALLAEHPVRWPMRHGMVLMDLGFSQGVVQRSFGRIFGLLGVLDSF